MRGLIGVLLLGLAALGRADVPLYVGQVEFLVSGDTRFDATASHQVTNLGLMVDPGGKVVGYVDGLNCKVLGIWKNVIIDNVGLTFTECLRAEYNGRYSGHLQFKGNAKEIDIRLSKFVVRQPGKSWRASVEGRLFQR